MAIRFPQMHVAQSVVNRILNTVDELDRAEQAEQPEPRQPKAPKPAPALPDSASESMRLDAALTQQQQGAAGEMPPLNQTGDPGGTLLGRRLISSVLDPKG